MTNRIMISKSGKRFGGKKKRKRWFREGKGERVFEVEVVIAFW